MGLWLVWSIQHQAWWADDHRGYTRDVQKAGMYSHDAAQKIVRAANVVTFAECAIPLECVKAWLADDTSHVG